MTMTHALPEETEYLGIVARSGYFDDGAWGAFPIGFSFDFFGNTYTDFYVTSNGLVMFGSSSTQYTNRSIPRGGAPNNYIAPFWDDLIIHSTGDIMYQTIGTAPNRKLVIQLIVDMNALGVEDAFLEAYMDTMESILFAMEITGELFLDCYDYARDSLEQTVYDTITQLNAVLNIFLATEEIKNSVFRMAVIDHSRQEGSTTFDIVKTKYPDYLQYLYLLSLSFGEINELDFEIFCEDFDSIFNSYGPLDMEDPFFLDSLDSHLYGSLSVILSSEEDTTTTLKSAPDYKLSNTLGSIWRTAQSILNPEEINASPAEVGFIVFYTIIEHFLEGDIIAKALEQSFNDFHAIITTPTVTTDYMGGGSNTSAELNGFIHEDGGATVTSSGIAWATHYNPTIEDNNEVSGTVTGSFLITLDNLTEGVTYFARAYATNSAGTAYGNCVEFTATSSSGIELAEFDHDFKIYPNPANAMAKFSFRLKSSESMALIIINLKGQITYQYDLGILPQGANRVELNLSELQSGIYNCQLAANGNVKATRKLVILH